MQHPPKRKQVHTLYCWHRSLPVLLCVGCHLFWHFSLLYNVSLLFAQCWQDLARYWMRNLSERYLQHFGVQVSYWCLQPCSVLCWFISDLVFLNTSVVCWFFLISDYCCTVGTIVAAFWGKKNGHNGHKNHGKTKKKNHPKKKHVSVYYTISYHIISYYITLYHIISYHIISYYIILYHIISYYILSHHIISY